MGGSGRVWVALSLLWAVGAGCSRQATAAVWNATVQVQGSSAIITVDVPGKQLGKDYHPHLYLDGGNEVMMFTPTYTFGNLAPGNHRARVTLSNPAHQDMPEMTRTLEFVVT